MITVFASFYPKEKDVENVKKILQGMVEPTRNEEGNVTYDLYSMDDVENEGTETFHLFEIYETPNGLHHHFIDAGKPGSFGSELIEMIKTYEIEWQTMNQMKIIQSLWD